MRSFTVICIALLFKNLSAQTLFPVRDDGETRSRSYHVIHYTIEVSFDEQKKMVVGKTAITFVPLLSSLATVDFDAEQMQFVKITLGKKQLLYNVLPKTVSIKLDKQYSFKDTLTVSIDYSCTPQKGLYFIQPDSAYPDKPRQIWTQGEDMDNHFWFPCYDFPNDKATSEVIATVRSSYTALSNGKLVEVKENKKDGTRTFHWKQDKPHSSYLIMLAAGEYAVLKDKCGSIPLEYYVYKNHVDDAKICFSSTPEIMKFFNEKIGVMYPWDKYAQVLIADFMFGGMENTSATTLLDNIAVFDARARIDRSTSSLIAHEMAHQWWGDMVTCKDWRHLWLNESFASYFDPLYHEYALGKDEFQRIMHGSQQAGINSDKTLGRRPIVSAGSYAANIYPRGASVLHMLRFILGDELFWRAINHYITKYQFQPVETNDFKVAIEETTGQNLYWFFDEWVYKAGYPVFDVSYQWSDSAKSILLSVKQTQTMDSLTGIFRTPVNVEIVTSKGSGVHLVHLTTKDTTIVLPSTEKPRLVIFDKGNWLIKEMRFSKSPEEWQYQAEFASDAIDRWYALDELSKKEYAASTLSLFERLSKSDPCWYVRQEALSDLGEIPDSLKNPAVKETILSALSDTKSNVRNTAAKYLSSYKTATVAAALRKAAETDSSYAVVASALTSLAKVDSTNAVPLLVRMMNLPATRNQMNNEPLMALASLDTAKAVEIAIQKARYGAPTNGRFAALRVINKFGKGNKEVVDLCVTLLRDNNNAIKSTAARMLGDIGDESVLPALQKLSAEKTTAADTAKASIEKIKLRKKS